MKRLNLFLVGASVMLLLALLASPDARRTTQILSGIGRGRGLGEDPAKREPLSPRICGSTSMGTQNSSFRPAWCPLRPPTTTTRDSSRRWSMCIPWADADGARRFSNADRRRTRRAFRLGDEGLQYAQSVNFRKGRYLVRIVAYQSSAIHSAGADGAGAWRRGKPVNQRGRCQSRMHKREEHK